MKRDQRLHELLTIAGETDDNCARDVKLTPFREYFKDSPELVDEHPPLDENNEEDNLLSDEEEFLEVLKNAMLSPRYL
jgi:hypothetical protein